MLSVREVLKPFQVMLGFFNTLRDNPKSAFPPIVQLIKSMLEFVRDIPTLVEPSFLDNRNMLGISSPNLLKPLGIVLLVSSPARQQIRKFQKYRTMIRLVSKQVIIVVVWEHSNPVSGS
jgi:hypothetical protein